MGKLLDDFLYLNRMNESTLSKTLYKELLKVEEEIIRRNEAVVKCKKSIKENAINIKSISEATGISRKTFYNNELLNKFVVDNASVDKETQDTIKTLKDKIEENENKINKFIQKDIEEISLRNEISKLQKELEHAHKRIKYLEKERGFTESFSGNNLS